MALGNSFEHMYSRSGADGIGALAVAQQKGECRTPLQGWGALDYDMVKDCHCQLEKDTKVRLSI